MIMTPNELAKRIEDVVAAGREGGLSDEEIAGQLQDAVDALINSML